MFYEDRRHSNLKGAYSSGFLLLTRPLSTGELKSVESLLKLKLPSKNIRVQGWAEKVHKKGKFFFVHVNDGLASKSLQAVVPRSVCKSVSVGSAVEVSGDWVKSEGQQQEMELSASAFQISGPNISGQVYDETSSTARAQLHLRSKSQSFANVLKLRSRLYSATHNFFMDNGFLHVDPPLLSRNDCEGAGEVFCVDARDGGNFFGHEEIFLPVSSQLHLEAIVSGLPKVYTISSTFRAEKSLSRRHLTEFRMLEAEFGFVHEVEEVCNVVEKYVIHVLDDLQNDFDIIKRCEDIQKRFGEKGLSTPMLFSTFRNSFPRLSYVEAESTLRGKGEVVSKNGFNKKQELLLVRHCQSPVFVTHFPSSQKPFYMKRDSDGNLAECFDFLTGTVGELAGGSLRETDPEKLRDRGCDSSLRWYIDLRERGQPPSGGFGIGIERFLQSLLGIVHIRDTVAFPRWWKHCSC